MRHILIDWLIDVHLKFKLRKEVLFLAVNLIDRTLEIEKIDKCEFQLLGITSLFIASKYEEIYPPPLSEYSYVCADAYVDEDILEMESRILNAVEFNLLYSSQISIFELYCFESRFNDNII